jgi:hypothetical protein
VVWSRGASGNSWRPSIRGPSPATRRSPGPCRRRPARRPPASARAATGGDRSGPSCPGCSGGLCGAPGSTKRPATCVPWR